MWVDESKKLSRYIVGETVRIKSKDNILKTLEGNRKLDGCEFTEQMWQYCGQTYPVTKVVNSLFNERQKRTFRPPHPLYILDKLICNGETDSFRVRCDHSCFFLWQEDWLEKV